MIHAPAVLSKVNCPCPQKKRNMEEKNKQSHKHFKILRKRRYKTFGDYDDELKLPEEELEAPPFIIKEKNYGFK